MTFAQPIWLWIGAAACAVLAVLLVRAGRARRRAIRRLAAAGPETTVAGARRWLRDGLALAGTALAFIALARPQAGYHWEATARRGVDLMFAVDTSKSMRAADLAPDRLTRAKLAVADLVRTLDNDRVGLVAFAGGAFVQAPMTADRTVFLEALDALDVDTIPVPGTDVASAIRAADQAMKSEPEHAKVLVLLSDGEDLAGSALDAAHAAAKDGLVIYTVGVGSRQGALIEVPDGHGGKELVRDEAGQPVRSHLDETMLTSIAQATGGAYRPLGADGRGLDQLYALLRTKLPQQTKAGAHHKIYAERFQIPLAAAIACLLVSFAIGDRRRRGASRLGGLGVMMAVLAVPAVAGADAPSPLAQGVNAYAKHDFTAAQKQFDAALHTADVARQHDAYYDLGDARYRAGQATEQKDRAATIATWKQAISAYDAAIALAPLDGHARFNRTFVAIKIAQLEQQQKRDQQKQQQQPQQQNQQGKQNKPQNGGGGQQAKSQQGQSGQQPNDQKGQNGQQPKDQQAQNGSGQQPKDQKGQNGQPKDQKGQNGQQPKDQQAQNGSGQQPKDQKGQNGQPKDQKGENGRQPEEQQAQNGTGEQQKDRQGSDNVPQPAQAPDAADRAKPAGGTVGSTESKQAAEARAAEAAADAKRREAGQLTHDEAVQLLNSVEDELRPMPIHSGSDARPRPTPTKDW
ncbi:MAG: VWA domain-containing protein [Deltaproteobacteria bacterium]